MMASSLTWLTSVLPSSFKYKLAGLRPLYTRILGFGQPLATVHSAAGSFRWTIDELTSQAYLRAAHEPAMQQLFLRHLRPGSVVWDVGAHAGFHSLFAALLVRPTGRVFAFEPSPRTRDSLEFRVRANPELDVVVMPYALGDCCSVLGMETSRGSQSHISESARWTVEGRTIDSLVDEGCCPPPDLIKIDVEGYEEPVLRGALETLRKFSPILLCDYNDSNTFELVARNLTPLDYDVRPGPPVCAVRC